MRYVADTRVVGIMKYPKSWTRMGMDVKSLYGPVTKTFEMDWYLERVEIGAGDAWREI